MFTFNKALVPLVVGIILVLVEPFGFTGSMNLEEFLTLAVVSLGVYFVPNKK